MLTINNEQFKYPTLCVSIVDNYLVFTTKKNGSRYFEDISLDSKTTHQINTINFYIHNSSEYRGDYRVLDFIFEVTPHKRVDEYIFLNLLNLDTFEELFSEKILKNFQFVFIIRNPLDRFFTGFFEKVDSIIGEIQSDKYNLFTFEILKKYFHINEYNSLKNLNQNTINLILNEYLNSIDSRIFNDEHLSFWNHFLLQFLQKTNLENKVKIIDLNDYSKMNIFNKMQQPSNKPWLSGWLNSIENKNNIDSFLLKFKSYFDVEMDAYNILLGKLNG